MAYDSTKPVTGGSLIAADVRENFRALEEDDFISSKTTSGYQKLLNGVIIQWGVTGTMTGGNLAQVAVTFPIVFPTALFRIALGLRGANSAVTESCPYVESTSPAPSTTGFTINKGYNGNASSHEVTCDWIAIGY
jgi:hypothetical protein